MYDQENEPTKAVSTKIESSTTATRSGDTARALLRRAKQASRRRFPGEEKIRIVMEGVRAEVSVADLCRREGIHPTIYYKWLKDFMEAGKGRLARETPSEKRTSERSAGLRQENQRLKLLVADLSLANHDTEKKPVLGLLSRKRYGRMKPERKREVIELVRRSPVPRRSRRWWSWDCRLRPIIAGSGGIGSEGKQDWWTGDRSQERCGTGCGRRKGRHLGERR